MLLCWAMPRTLLWFGFLRPPQERGAHEGGLQWCSPWVGVSRVPAQRRSPAEGQQQGRATGARLVLIIGVGRKYHNIAMKE